MCAPCTWADLGSSPISFPIHTFSISKRGRPLGCRGLKGAHLGRKEILTGRAFSPQNHPYLQVITHLGGARPASSCPGTAVPVLTPAMAVILWAPLLYSTFHSRWQLSMSGPPTPT